MCRVLRSVMAVLLAARRCTRTCTPADALTHPERGANSQKKGREGEVTGVLLWLSDTDLYVPFSFLLLSGCIIAVSARGAPLGHYTIFLSSCFFALLSTTPFPLRTHTHTHPRVHVRAPAPTRTTNATLSVHVLNACVLSQSLLAFSFFFRVTVFDLSAALLSYLGVLFCFPPFSPSRR